MFLVIFKFLFIESGYGFLEVVCEFFQMIMML